MLLFPLMIELREKKIPFLTLWVCVICLIMFVQQENSFAEHQKALRLYCDRITNTDLYSLLKHIKPEIKRNSCARIYLDVRKSEAPDLELIKLAREAKPLNFLNNREQEIAYLYHKIKRGYVRFEQEVPVDITNERVYLPTNIQFKRMFTSSFSHISWSHVLWNLLFFIIFGGAVEILMGPLFFIVFVFCTCITTNVAYSYSVVSGYANDLPSLGLSGVVMGMVAVIGMLLPRAKVTLFFWLLFFFSFFRLPALLVASWYVYWDLYNMNRYLKESHIGYVAHVSGAFTGITFSTLLLLFLPRYIRQRKSMIMD